MDCSFKFLRKIFEWPRGEDNIIPKDEVEAPAQLRVRWSKLHISIVREYFRYISRTREFEQLLHTPVLDLIFAETFFFSPKMASFSLELRGVFMVPRLKKLHKNNKPIKRCRVVEAFLSFLLRLLHHKPDLDIDLSWYHCSTHNLEVGLRSLRTILGESSLMPCDDIEYGELQKLLAEFEAVANEAGNLVYSLFVSTDRGLREMEEGFSAVSHHFRLLDQNIMNLLSSFSGSAYVTPNTSVVDSLLIVDSLIYDLEDLMKRKDIYWTAYVKDKIEILLKDEIEVLYCGLVCFQSSIKDIGSPQASEIGELKEAVMRIGDMAHQAEYVIISFLAGDAPHWYPINRLTNISYKIQLIRTDVLEIINKYKIGSLKVAKNFSAQLPLQAKRNPEVDDITVGFEDNVIDILDQLVGGRERLEVISIYGMPGIGKTTLAKKLYNHSSVNYWFDKLSWCVISQIYKRKSTMTDILIHIASELEKDKILEMEEEYLAEHIYKTLKGRRYLIIVDDVWDSNMLDDLKRYFPDDENGSRILFTTRNRDVAPPNCRIYVLPSLSNEQCWELLEKKVFGNEPCPSELIGIGNKIAANCCGLPLAVVVIAGILSTMDKDKNAWKEVEGNLASYLFDDGDDTVMHILELSYKHLSEYLKPCFLYFAAFLEDKEIPIGNLTRLWIAEGFIRKEVGKSAENVAKKYLMELVDKSLVIVTKRSSDGGIKTCVIHDLLRDLCLKISKEENFLKFLEDNYSIHEKCRRLLVLKENESLSHCRHVRSLHFIHPVSPTFSVRDLILLRVLNCKYPSTHFIGMKYLFCLRYLVVRELPAEIGALLNLEYLLVETKKTVHLPVKVLKIEKLRYIHVSSEAIYGRDCYPSFPPNNLKLYGRDCYPSFPPNNLEFLSGIIIDSPEDEQILKCSPHLCKLKLWAYRDVDLSFLTQLESLNITFCGVGSTGKTISFPSNIKKLTISAARLTGEDMSKIGRLQKLEVLKLRSISFEDKRWDTRDDEFQKLRFLKLDNVINLVQWNVASSQHFPELERLILSNCYNLEEIPGEIGDIATLQLIEIQGRRCLKSLVESAKRIQQEQWDDMGNEELKVIITTTNYW